MCAQLTPFGAVMNEDNEFDVNDWNIIFLLLRLAASVSLVLLPVLEINKLMIIDGSVFFSL